MARRTTGERSGRHGVPAGRGGRWSTDFVLRCCGLVLALVAVVLVVRFAESPTVGEGARPGGEVLSATSVEVSGDASRSPGGETGARDRRRAEGEEVPLAIVSIESVRWEGRRIEVRGTVQGEDFFPHCRLLEAAKNDLAASKESYWWDRSASRTYIEGDTFRLTFVEFRPRLPEAGDPRSTHYWVTCHVADALSKYSVDVVPVEGRPAP